MSLKQNIEINKEKQEELKRIQHNKDKGNTYGHDSKNPCKVERESSLKCLEIAANNREINCRPYFDNYKKCNEFWLAVQTYRSKAFKKRRHDLPVGEEYDKWKAQLPNWVQTGNLNVPDDI